MTPQMGSKKVSPAARGKTQFRRQSARQDQDVKMAGHKDEGSAGREMLASINLDAFSEPENAAHRPPPETPGDEPLPRPRQRKGTSCLTSCCEFADNGPR